MFRHFIGFLSQEVRENHANEFRTRSEYPPPYERRATAHFPEILHLRLQVWFLAYEVPPILSPNQKE